jgi:hypothetical protein
VEQEEPHEQIPEEEVEEGLLGTWFPEPGDHPSLDEVSEESVDSDSSSDSSSSGSEVSVHSESIQVPVQSPVKTRTGRVSRKPAKFSDFVLDWDRTFVAWALMKREMVAYGLLLGVQIVWYGFYSYSSSDSWPRD